MKSYKDFAVKKVDGAELEKEALLPVLRRDLFASPVIIESIELLFNNGFYFVRTRSIDGSEGIAIASERAVYLHPILNQLVIPHFIGKDARDLDSLIDGVYLFKGNYKLTGLALWCCVSWVEASILDMLGKTIDKTVGYILGDIINDHVSIYVASSRRDTTPDEEVEILESRIAETGAKAVKFKVGGRMSRNADSIDGRSEGLMYLARKRLGDNIAIHADGNGSYDPPRAIEIGKILEEINAYFYEEPCPLDYLEETKEVADALNIPIAFGEQETSLRRFRWLIENNAVKVVQPDLQYNGGFIRTTRVARMAAKAGIQITPHVSGGINYVYVCHFASYTPNIGEFQELKSGFNEIRDFFNPPLEIKGGILRVPNDPGFGTHFDSRMIKKAIKI